MKFIKESRIANIISKKLLGELSPDDESILASWLAESEKNRILYEKLVSGQSFQEQNRLRDSFDLSSGVEEIDRKIRRRTLRNYSIIAASVAAILLIGIIILRPFSQVSEPVSTKLALEALPPGNLKAVMSQGGAEIILTEDTVGNEWEKYVNHFDSSSELQQITISTPRGGEYKLRLNDGTVVWLNAETSIRYPKQFTGDQRVVHLTGEAYFEVAKHETTPFIVEFEAGSVRVLGTSFNISAYEDDAEAIATLVSGKVEVCADKSCVELVPGKQAVLKYGVTEIEVNEVDASLYAMWTQGTFVFEKMRLEDICKKLSRWFDVEFEFIGNSGNERFTGGTWKYMPLGEFLLGIEKVTNVTFEYTADKVIVNNK